MICTAHLVFGCCEDEIVLSALCPSLFFFLEFFSFFVLVFAFAFYWRRVRGSVCAKGVARVVGGAVPLFRIIAGLYPISLIRSGRCDCCVVCSPINAYCDG